MYINGIKLKFWLSFAKSAIFKYLILASSPWNRLIVFGIILLFFPNWSCQNVDNSVTVFGFRQNPIGWEKKWGVGNFPRSGGKLSHFDNLICFGINPFCHNAGQTNLPLSTHLLLLQPTFVGNICGRSSIISQVRGRNDSKLPGCRPRKMFQPANHNPLHKPKNHTPPPLHFPGALTSFKPRKHLCEQKTDSDSHFPLAIGKG